MGSSKSLLPVGGKSFLAAIIGQAREAGLDPVIVVAGHEADPVRHEAEHYGARIILHTGWREGKGSSIAAGIAAAKDCDAVIILLADSPSIRSTDLRALVDAFAKGHDLAASSHDGQPGPPSLFAARWFEALAALSGDRGAQEVLKKHDAPLVAPAPSDVDSPEEYRRLSARRARD